jgi:NAD(P) transhydrogenase
MANYDYDMLVIGSGPAGQRAAIQAAKLDKRVAIVERKETVGGVAVNVGTIPSKTLREAVLYLSGYRERGLYGDAYVVKRDVRLADLLVRTDYVTRHEVDVTLNQILRNRVEQPEEPEFHLFAVDIESAAYAVIRDEEWFRRIWNAAGRG